MVAVGAPGGRELTVVVPVYNEESAIAGVLAAWAAELTRLDVDHLFAVYDDGSRDGSPRILDELAAQDARFVVTHQANRGHGPTIVRGYREARTPWILQIDSDGEMAPAHFAPLWHARHAHDFLVGARHERASVPVRRLVSAASRAAVHVLVGRGVRDVNSPYRLMRRDTLCPLLDRLPADAFAPNTLLSGLAGRNGLRIHEAPVPHEGRRTGRGSLNAQRLAAGVLRSLRDTIVTAVELRRRRR